MLFRSDTDGALWLHHMTCPPVPGSKGSRISKAKAAEKILKLELDQIVSNDNLMYDSLIILSQNEDPAHTPMQNAVRKYYKFIR